ncbi:carboxymuconolactone decarboxylase family protein [Pseudoalteromonas sp. C2R02]|uniref:carboxymuconolactone decarboxylase family protein n=1 Tax=Pseudoalteromonas sp. C2R02 TaxID=2841565 RepID=UPI001C08EA08|nr:carboxymuconolactone decarboxylase family protein [Pseudoalteromonas sp. C2R02]MBU2970883.1 carboxymuconolactone decarboxylase family protein [Pseudoalteromonas sp. C2R02]
MQNRLKIETIEPQALTPMYALEVYLNSTDIEPSLKGLIKLNASIINKCAYCIQMHSTEARKNGETEQRIYALSAWQESPLFNETERAVLQLTEEVTLLSEQGITDLTYQKCITLLEEELTAQCIMHIVTINAWNRIALATKMSH